MKILDSEAAKSLIRLYVHGARQDWLGAVGDSISRWLTTPEMMSIQGELDFNSEAYIPLTVKEPKLARECFMYCCHGNAIVGEDNATEFLSLKILQVNATGDKCRVLWEVGGDNRSPLEVSLHLVCHGAHSVGPGNVVYHCQPMNTLALVSLLGEEEETFYDSLLSGYAAIISMIPDGIGVIPWAMKTPLRLGKRITEDMYQTMEDFMANIRQHIFHQEVLVLKGEGLICASRSEQHVYTIINSIERAAKIRLLAMSARKV